MSMVVAGNKAWEDDCGGLAARASLSVQANTSRSANADAESMSGKGSSTPVNMDRLESVSSGAGGLVSGSLGRNPRLERT